MTDSLRVTVDSDRDPAVVSVHGKVVFDTHQPLLDALTRLAEVTQPRIVVDFADVPMCDSTGLNVLLQAQRRAAAKGGWLRLTNTRPLVDRVLMVTNLATVLLPPPGEPQ